MLFLGDWNLVFVCDDLEGSPHIPATVATRTETPLRTSLQCNGARVDMVEHIMAALAGLQIDNCEIHVNQQEMPGMDGSSLPFVEAITAAGIVQQDAVRARWVIPEVIRCGDEKNWIEVRPCSSDRTVLQYRLDYGIGNPIGRQSLEISLTSRVFCKAVAPSRTFLLERDAVALQAQGLGRRATRKDLLVFGPDGPIDNELRFPDECVRHKILDMVGDLALAGCDLIGRFVAHCGGHRLNAQLVREIMARSKNQQGIKRCA